MKLSIIDFDVAGTISFVRTINLSLLQKNIKHKRIIKEKLVYFNLATLQLAD